MWRKEKYYFDLFRKEFEERVRHAIMAPRGNKERNERKAVNGS